MGRVDDPSWSALFQSHIKALRGVAQTWRDMEKYGSIDNPYYQLAIENAEKTERMVKFLEEEEERYTARRAMDVPQQEEPDLKIPEPQMEKTANKKWQKKRDGKKTSSEAKAPNAKLQQEKKQDGPVQDPSGLFSIDSNPMTPNEFAEIEARKGKRMSRDWDGERQQAPHATSGLISKREAHPAKRQKQLHGAEQTKADQRAQTFEQNVELRLKEKEDKRQQKLNRKRKRESGDSTLDPKPNEDLIKHLSPALKPSKQRKKDLKDQLEVARASDPSSTFADVKAANTNKAKRTADRLKSGYLADTEKPDTATSKPKKKKQRK